MEDLYKDDPNSWLRRTRFSKTVYKRPDPSQIPIISITELKLGSSKPNSNYAVTTMPVTCDSTTKTSQCTTNPTLNSNPDNGFTDEVQGFSSSKTNKTGTESKHDILKEVKKAVRRLYLAPPPSERRGAKMEKSSTLEKSSKVH